MKKVFFILAMLLSTASFAQIQSATLTASGLTCSMCSKAIYKTLLKVPSVQKVDVDIDKSAYLITFKSGSDVSPANLKKAVENAGFSVAQLKLTANIPKMAVDASAPISIQGSTYRIIRADGKVIQGTQTFTLVDKAFLSDKEFRKYADDIPRDSRGEVFTVIM